MLREMAAFKIEGMLMRYNIFVSRFYNMCKSLGMEQGKIMPSRAFCSDESQGYPIILIAKHFGTFPFNHGMVGGIVATDRHGPHSHHGRDMVIFQASHVGYDPTSGQFGSYRRLQTGHDECTSSCGKIISVLDWYTKEYRFARNQVLLHTRNGNREITIDNQLIRKDRPEGLVLKLEKLIEMEEGHAHVLQARSTARSFQPADSLIERLPPEVWNGPHPTPIGDHLTAEFFTYQRDIGDTLEGQQHLESNLINVMPAIVTSKNPALEAAKYNTQAEFDRTYRTIIKEPGYQDKRLIFISGLHIDISPQEDQIFPLTKFAPWAAYVQNGSDGTYTLEQGELYERLAAQSTENPDQIALDEAIDRMASVQEVKIKFT
jgi:hypothetical protein